MSIRNFAKGKMVFVSLAASAVMALSGMHVLAAPTKMADGQLFDAQYYAAANPDVVKVFGSTDANILYEHYQKYGKKEGRLPVAPSTNAALAGSKSAAAKTVKTSAKFINQAASKNSTSVSDSFADQIIALTNAERIKAGCVPLVKSDVLMQDAQVRAIEAAQCWSHTRPDGQPWYTIDPDNMYGENLSIAKDAPTAMAVWLNSPMHKVNMLDPRYRTIGVARCGTTNVQEFGL